MKEVMLEATSQVTLDYLPPLRTDVFSELPIATTTIRLTAVAGKDNISAFASVYTASC
jgi:hypothetical protein